VYENQYNYRFDPRFRAMNMNPLAQFNVDADGETIPVRDEDGRIVEYRTTSTKTDALNRVKERNQTVKTKSVGKNGFIVKALKNI
jgi:urocanate hydratase